MVKVSGKAFKAIKETLRQKVAMANKRVTRLEGNNMQDLPAYRQYRDLKGGERFTSAGDDYNELQKELSRVNQFISSKTSTVRGANRHMKDIAERTGIKYKSVKELPEKTQKFFQLSSKIEQYLKNVEGSYHAIDSDQLFNEVSEYVQTEKIDLLDPRFNADEYLDGLIEKTSRDKFDEEDLDAMDWFTVDGFDDDDTML